MLVALTLAEIVLRVAFRGSVDDLVASRQDWQDAPHRILCVGDSYTFGLYYRPEESYPGRLQRLLNGGRDGAAGDADEAGDGPLPWAVINAGIPAQNTRQILAALPAQLRRFTPEVVILLAGHNNRWNLADPANASAWQRFRDGLVLVKLLRIATAREDAEGQRGRITHWSEDRIAVQGAAGEAVIEVDKTLDRRSDEAVIESCTADFREFVRLVRESGALPVLATYPSPESGYLAPATAAREVAAATDCPLADFRARFETLLQTHPYAEILIPGDRHPTERGHAFMARSLRDLLRARGVVDAVPVLDDPDSLYPATLEWGAGDTLHACGPPGAEFQVIVGASSEPAQKFGSHDVPVAADEVFRDAQDAAALKGFLDPQGRAQVRLPDELRGRARVAALVVFHDHKLRTPDLMVREISAALAVPSGGRP